MNEENERGTADGEQAPLQRLVRQSDDFFTTDEVVMLRFLTICEPSLDPEAHEMVETVCRRLCSNRRSLTEDSYDKCERYLNYPPSFRE